MEELLFKEYKSKDGVYFAADEAEKCAATLLNRAQSFYRQLNSNSYLEKLRRMYEAYHGVYGASWTSNHQVNFTGEHGELVQVPVNHFRNLAQHILTMITSNRPIIEARAINTDYKSMAQTYVANAVLDYYMREKRLEDALKKAVEMSLIMGAGFVKLSWNATGGDIFDADPDTGEYNYNGELEFTNLSPLDVVVDGSKESWNNEWVLCRTFVNKFNLMAKYPELAERIQNLATKSDASISKLSIFSNDKTEDVPIYEFFHKPTEALPEGRYVLFCEADIILLDTKMPYRMLPVFRVAPGDILGTPYGYSPMFDIFPLQEVLNSLISTIATNQAAFGVQNIFVQRGADLSINNLEGSMNIIEGNIKPEPLNLTNTPKEIFEAVELIVQTMETISGVNSVARGNPEASLRSGNALALVQSMALQFVSGLQQSYVQLIEDVGTAVINILKDYATAPKVIQVVGKTNRPYFKEFTGDSISNISRVICDVGNPLSRTTSGRVQMADQLMQMGLIKNPQQYFQVMNTGRLDTMFEGDTTELMNIKAENEMMMEGEPPVAVMLDAHRTHIMEHKAVLNDPDLRRNPELVQLVLNHIQEHLEYLRGSDPALLALINEQPLPPMPGMESAMGGMMPPPGQESPEQGFGGPGSMTDAAAAEQQNTITGPGLEEQRMPSMPKVPASALPNPQIQDQAMGNVK